MTRHFLDLDQDPAETLKGILAEMGYTAEQVVKF